MIKILTMPQNTPFAISILLVFILAFIEGLGTIMGIGLSNLIETALPDINLELNTPDLEQLSLTTKALSWIRVGQLPILIILIIGLIGFSIFGLLLQSFIYSRFNFILPAWIASIVSLTLTIPWVRLTGGFISKVIPKDETSAVSLDSLVGRFAIITLGVAKNNYPAQAKVKDEYNKYHYIYVEPDIKNSKIKQGESVLLVRRKKHIYYAIKNTKIKL